MATERTFDYEYLERLVRDNPTATLRELARNITDHEREIRGDPGYGPINPAAVGAAKNRYRDAWEAKGIVVPEAKRSPRARTQPWANLPKEHWNNVYIEYLRILTRLARGETGLPPVRVTGSLNFARQLEDERQVVDLTPNGRPYLRQARPDELDGEGDLIAYYARYPGLSSQLWQQLGTAERRADASIRHLRPDYDGPTPASVSGTDDRRRHATI